MADAKSMNHQLTTRELLDRGWTKTLIRKFLPTPDGTAAVAHWANYRGTNTYLEAKVQAVELTSEFEAAFLRSWKGRLKGISAETALAKLRS